MKCPKCGEEMEKMGSGFYACTDCGADYEVGSRGLVQLSEGVRPVTNPADEDLLDAYEDIFSPQDHLPDNEYP